MCILRVPKLTYSPADYVHFHIYINIYIHVIGSELQKILGLMALSLMRKIKLEKLLDQRTYVIRIIVKGRVIPLCELFETITNVLKNISDKDVNGVSSPE